MPESSADTFWGKGFLATALGTASPDRKKTHKGQKKFDFIIIGAISASTERKRAISTSDACKDFLKQVVINMGGNSWTQDPQSFMNLFVLSFLKIVKNQTGHFGLSSPVSRTLELHLLLNMIHPSSTESPEGPIHETSLSVFFPNVQKQTG